MAAERACVVVFPPESGQGAMIRAEMGADAAKNLEVNRYLKQAFYISDTAAEWSKDCLPANTKPDHLEN